MKINIHKRLKANIDEDIYKYLLLLEFNSDLISEIELIRKKYKLPIKVPGNYATKNLPNDLEHKVYVDLRPLENKYNVPTKVAFYLGHLVIFDFIPFIKSPLMVSTYSERQKDPPSTIGVSPEIIIMDRLSKRQLFDEIENHWEEIERGYEEVEKVFKNRVKKLHHIPIRDIETDVLILRYRKSGLKHFEIKEKLQEHNIYLEEESIRKRYASITKVTDQLFNVNA